MAATRNTLLEQDMFDILSSKDYHNKDTHMDVDIAVIQQQIISLKEKQESDHKALQKLQSDRDKALIWGLIVLGSTVISLSAWIMKNILKVL